MSYSRDQLRAILVFAYGVVPAVILLFSLNLFNVTLLGRALYAFAEVNFFLLLYRVGHWEFIGFSFRRIYLGASFVAGLLLMGVDGGRQASPALFVGFGIAGIVFTFLRWRVFLAGRIPGRAVDLQFPFRNGLYASTDGGDGRMSVLVNYHYRASIHQGAATNRSMTFAVDIVKLGTLGLSAKGWIPGTLDAYYIYNEPVFSPVEGTVAAVLDGIPNNEPFVGPYPYSVGNHVVIRNGTVYVVLGHLNMGSLCVKAGDTVRRGDLLGRIGNSGLTERPHLHLQACVSADGDYWKGDGVPVTFNGIVPVKGELFEERIAAV